MNVFVDIDNTICLTGIGDDKYARATPIQEKIEYINSLYDKGDRITYWTARGNTTHKDYTKITTDQLKEWGCRYHVLSMGTKPSFDLLIDDKTVHPRDLPRVTDSKKTAPEIVQKGWGHEIIFVNNDLYCGKILHFNTGAKFSMHYHLKKKETWYIKTGTFIFRFIDTKTADIIEMPLNIGDSITNEIGEPHQIICLKEGDVFEVSTHHFDSDSYRVMKGDTQQLSDVTCSGCT